MNLNSKNTTTSTEGMLANANSTSSFKEERYYLKGNSYQIAAAQKAASLLGIETRVENGLTFVMSKENFESMKRYLISNQIDGWYNYATYWEICEIKGEYYFGGKYHLYPKEIRKTAKELGIEIRNDQSVLFATSKEDFDTIIKELDKKLTLQTEEE